MAETYLLKEIVPVIGKADWEKISLFIYLGPNKDSHDTEDAGLYKCIYRFGFSAFASHEKGKIYNGPLLNELLSGNYPSNRFRIVDEIEATAMMISGDGK